MDGTENQKDTSQSGDAPSGTKGTSETKPETFTKGTQDKAVSDALSAAGRDAKTLGDQQARVDKMLEDARKVSEATAERQIKLQRAEDEAELKAVVDDPDATKSVRARHEAKQRLQIRQTELTKGETELKAGQVKVSEGMVQVKEFEKTQQAAKIAKLHNVDVKDLVRFTDGSPKVMEELAKILPKKDKEPPVPIDSAKTVGGGAMPDTAKGKMQSGFAELHK